MILLSITLFLYLYSIHCHVILSSASRTATATTTGEHSFRYSLSDPPIRGDSILYLDNNEQYLNANATRNQWQLILPSSLTVAGEDAPIPARVPGDLLSDLVAANRLPEPYYETNFKSTYFCGDDPARIWTYKIEFDASSLLPPTTTSHHDDDNDNEEEEEDDIILLVLDGIKMGARIELNQQEIGITSDQFLRYQFDVTNILSRNATNNNTLLIRLDPSILTDGRFMPCSGGWDWAPFSNCSKTTDTHSSSFTKGITKSVYLTRVSSAAITAIVPQTFYKGVYPTTALRDGSHDGFQVQVKIHLWSRPRTHIQGEIQLQGSWGANTSQVVEWMGGDAVMTLSIMAEAKDIRLWWPTGLGRNPRELGKRPMYDVVVHFVPRKESNIDNNNNSNNTNNDKSIVAVSDARRIGFRHFALVTGNDTDPMYVQNATGQEGTAFTGMYFRVNGVALWSRGANMIPMDELEGRLNAKAHIQLVQSAVLANMNTLRVWGGGMFLPSAWYDACDEYGILVMQDQMYAQGGHSPKETETQELEIRHNIRLLSNHPSVVIWDGCNECTVEMDKATSIYATFVMRVVAEEDESRSIWPSCPANGWSSGVERLTSRPIPGKALTTPNQVPRRIETHGPYVHGGGFPAVNGNDHEPVNPKLPIVIDPNMNEMGVARPSVFASEFGAGGVMSSFESMSATLDPGHWSLHGGAPPDNCTDGFNRQCAGGNVMAQRNYPCDSIVKAYFQTEQDYFEQVGPQSFQRQLYHCMIGQALQMKSTIEERRSKNELGHLVWQLNEIWPTGGWGSLEYGNGDMAGQVLGGRWKPLHYFYRQSTFADVLATCGGTGVGYIRNDAAFMFHGGVVIHVIHLETGELIDQQMVHKNITLSPGPGSLQVLECPIVDGRTHFLSIDILMYSRDMIIHNTPILLKPPKEFTNRIWCDSGLEWTILGVSQNVIAVEVTATVPVALLVVLTTQAPGRFSDNAFTIVGGSKIVNFHPIDDADMQLFQDSLRIEDLAMNQHNQCRESETESN